MKNRITHQPSAEWKDYPEQACITNHSYSWITEQKDKDGPKVEQESRRNLLNITECGSNLG